MYLKTLVQLLVIELLIQGPPFVWRCSYLITFKIEVKTHLYHVQYVICKTNNVSCIIRKNKACTTAECNNFTPNLLLLSKHILR